MPQELKLGFTHIDRSFEPTMQPDGAARALLNVDPTWLAGRLRMAASPSATDVVSPTNGVTINNCNRIERPDGTLMIIGSTDTGIIYVWTAVSGVGCAASVVKESLLDFFTNPEISDCFREDEDDIDDLDNQGGY